MHIRNDEASMFDFKVDLDPEMNKHHGRISRPASRLVNPLQDPAMIDCMWSEVETQPHASPLRVSRYCTAVCRSLSNAGF